MLSHVILGLLSDTSDHGYRLLTRYCELTGEEKNSGGLFRTLHSMEELGLLSRTSSPAGADARQIHYEITDKGRREFVEWLTTLPVRDGDFFHWILFIDRAPAAVRDRVLRRRREDLFIEMKALSAQRDDALNVRRERDGTKSYSPLPPILFRRIALVTAEIGFIDELQSDYQDWQRSTPTTPRDLTMRARSAVAGPTPATEDQDE